MTCQNSKFDADNNIGVGILLVRNIVYIQKKSVPVPENVYPFLDVSENDPAGGGNFLAISTDLQSGMLSGNSESHLSLQEDGEYRDCHILSQKNQ